jgi:PDZ domain-containing protein
VTAETAETPDRATRWPYIALGGLFVFGFVVVLLWNLELPYVAFSPGPTSDAANAVEADGVELFPPNGELLMLTVVSQDVNVFEALIAGLDPNIDLVPKEAVRREGESDEEYRNRVLQQMDDSNFRAIAVALGYLGYEMVPVEVVINEFVEGVPAADVLELGDSILEVDGQSVASVSDIGPLLEDRDVGSDVLVKVARGEEQLELEVELAERTDEPGVAMIGVVLGELTRPPFPIELRPGDIGGPSAGMMHTLAIIDSLTEGDLTGGEVIAGTGTIRVDGTIGPIGGIRQKVVGAEAAGARYILVPVDNYERALTAERSTIEIVPVSTIDEAVDFLDGLAAA